MLTVYVKSIIVFTFQLLDWTDEDHKVMKMENECSCESELRHSQCCQNKSPASNLYQQNRNICQSIV